MAARERLAHCQSLLEAGRFADARRCARSVARIATDDLDAQLGAGLLLSACQRHGEALECFERAARLDANDPDALFNLASCLRFLGRFDEAEQLCDRALALRPLDGELHYLRCDLRRQTAERNHVVEIERALAAEHLSPQERIFMSYALAKECEDLGEHARSFAALSAGSALKRRTIRYDVELDLRLMDEAIVRLDARWCRAASARHDGAGLIFIVGLPRSGTTLVERILASHRAVRSAGELDFLGELIFELAGARHPHELIERASSIDMRTLADRYLRLARGLIAWDGLFIDKRPDNFLYCGFIARAFPAARIVHVTRNPMASCFALYKALFGRAYPYSYDLTELGRYYLGYRHLMEHWHTVLPGRILDLPYEELVLDTRRAASRALAFCGLDWDEACLDFTRSATASTTASAFQVRQPIYTTSLDTWRHHEAVLAPLAQILGKAPATG